MLTLTEPQVWVLIGVFATAIFGMLSWQTVFFTRTLTTSIGSLREVMDIRFENVDRQFENVDRQFAELRGKIDDLDRDVSALTRRVFGAGPQD